MSASFKWLGALALAGSLAAGSAHAQPSVTANQGGAPLAQAEKGISGTAGAMIRNNQAAANDPTVHSGLSTKTQGLEEPIAANKAPGSDRLAVQNEGDKLITPSAEVKVNLLLGHGLYSTTGQRLGTVTDILLAPNREPLMVVQFGDRTVAVPWSRLRFGLPGALLHGTPVLPGATEHDLRQLPQLTMNGSE